MKKFFALLLAGLMMVSLVACSDPKDQSGEDGKVNPPSLTYLYNTSDSHKAIGEFIQGVIKNAGLNIDLQNQEWNTFLETRKNGDYSIARNGWVADYNDPICFLDMWTSNSGNNDVQFGKGAHASLKMYNLDLTEFGYDVKVENGTWAETYDVLISKIKSCTDNTKRYGMMHVAEDMLMDTGCIVPLYFYTDLFMINKGVEGFYSNPLGYKYFMQTKYNGNTDAISVCLASEPQTIDPALNSAVDGATMLAHLFAGLAKWSQDANGNLVIAPDLAEELVEPVTNDDGTLTYTYTLKDSKWSNGDAVTAEDFAASWKRAASAELGADYGYMFEVVKGYGTDDLAVEAVDAKTLKVTLANTVPYWNELLAFPTYFPVHSSNRGDTNGTWATNVDTYISNGPYKLTQWNHNSLIVMEKNGNYYDNANVTMNKLNFYLSDDTNNMLTNFKNGDWQFIDDVPTNEISNLKKNNPDEFKIVGQIGTYYVCWNINENLLPGTSLTGVELEKAQQEIRKAIGLLIDRNSLVEDVAQGGQVPASSFVAMGMTDADGKEFYQNAGDNDGYDGYYNTSEEAQEENYKKGIEILEKYYNLKK